MKELIIDCFAGGGGASVGIEMALGRPVAKQVARIGNSVVPIMAQKLVEANCPYLKVGERVPNLNIDDSQGQLRFA
ncbi:hypothetical protein [Blautia sp. AM47-4]|jgi:hypothetical protein|uniref:hypothetical protein n=1 Tax=Blautia sp. AM47-4 TaxID=2292979 RepID=UPI000E5D537B|nr:hypothetical protein [Blautia sp. AM47-4]RHS44956.1 hypothetical protein DW965_14620 [Blautia sp. AM47-4]